jgi:hypothetical protein
MAYRWINWPFGAIPYGNLLSMPHSTASRFAIKYLGDFVTEFEINLQRESGA